MELRRRKSDSPHSHNTSIIVCWSVSCKQITSSCAIASIAWKSSGIGLCTLKFIEPIRVSCCICTYLYIFSWSIQIIFLTNYISTNMTRRIWYRPNLICVVISYKIKTARFCTCLKSYNLTIIKQSHTISIAWARTSRYCIYFH